MTFRPSGSLRRWLAVWKLLWPVLLVSCGGDQSTKPPPAAPAPACLVSPDTLSFGNVTVGSHRDLGLTIKNTGGGTLAGTVGLNCAGFSIVSGEGSYSLAAGQEWPVTVRFSPTEEESVGCSVAVGDTLCGAVPCTGAGTARAPACLLSPNSLDFGPVTIGQSAEFAFEIQNTGGGTLSGAVSLECPDFRITAGDGSFALAGGQSRSVTVQFNPTAAGVRDCSIGLGSIACGALSCTGVGEESPVVCQVNPAQLDFDSVTVGASADLDLHIVNAGGGTLAGTVSLSCPGYSIVAGEGDYSLGRGEEHLVTVRFEPAAEGRLDCLLGLGSVDCEDLSCEGIGVAPPPPPPDTTMVQVPAGTFLMGSPDDELGRASYERQHEVSLTRSLLVGKREVTQGEWQAVMGWNESAFPGPDRPVEQVNWYDAVMYCNQKSIREDRTPVYTISVFRTVGNHIRGATVVPDWSADGYRLLTEAEWEYACRATSATSLCNGGLTFTECQVDPKLFVVGWYCGDTDYSTHEVGAKEANEWGLRDMHGNVWEWCWDATPDPNDTYPPGPVTDPTGSFFGSLRSARGGAWLEYARRCRSATRNFLSPIAEVNTVGLRVARLDR